MLTNELMLMVSKFLYGEYDPEEFSFDFPDRMYEVYDEFSKENEALCDCLDDLSYVCQWYDPHNTGVDGTIGLDEFKQRVFDIYEKALPMARENIKRIS